MSTKKIQQLEKEQEAKEKIEKRLAVQKAEIKSTNENLSRLLSTGKIELKGIFEDIIDSYILVDLFGNVLKMNNAAVNFFGYDITKEKFNFLTVIHEEDYDYAMSSFSALLKNGVFKNYQARIYTKKREIKWMHVNSSILYDDTGKPVFAQGVVRDTTKERNDAIIFDTQKKQLNAIVDYSPIGIFLIK